MDYKTAGVDTSYAQKLIHDLKDCITQTHLVPGVGSVTSQYGGFAGRFALEEGSGFDLVATTDGVGTKIELLRRFGYLEGVGQDLVAMCANDLYCAGATPAFFLDYIACGKLHERWYNTVIRSIADACRKVPMALLGGETAEHPGVMAEEEFDLAGFAVGVVPRTQRMPQIEKQRPGDLVIGLPASGLHANGFSLVRRIFAELENNSPEEFQAMTRKQDFYATWLAPTRIYHELPQLWQIADIKALAHITGGGIYENLPRVLAPGLGAVIERPEPFRLRAAELLERYVARDELFRTFNMGTGMVLIAENSELEKIRRFYPEATVIGTLEPGEGVELRL
ncbi:MAG: phosphoribosylformylglycinamidine cyclo-ligase [Turneriella sp.]|nr:phosphoribosylformylglycinamidine cyclo-ligase [Leptospiraceae bacterium]MCX7632544.1 phosphoribosylformylglycinamidine cyclo-ligase [Turneriella sp.]